MVKEETFLMKNDNEQTEYVGKKWFFTVILTTLMLLGIVAAIIMVVDPFFHYHAPLEGLAYPLLRDNERYQNDGILRNYEYDAMIIGTSMAENFKTSECDELFDVNAVKVPVAGGLYNEIDANIRRALDYNADLKIIIRTMDSLCLLDDKDATKDIYDYAEYLTNKNPFDDVSYILNKEVLVYTRKVLDHSNQGNPGTSFDDYANWMEEYRDWFGRFYVVQRYTLGDPAGTERILTEEEKDTIIANVYQNIVCTAEQNPDVIFYVFIPPYSIGYWDELHNDGKIDYMIDAQQVAIEEILQCPNIKLFSFDNNFDLTCNWDNYTDQCHYGEWVNTQILEWMSEGRYLLTLENYQDYLEEIRNFYNSYDYSSIERVW